jgi:hypothetical protein
LRYQLLRGSDGAGPLLCLHRLVKENCQCFRILFTCAVGHLRGGRQDQEQQQKNRRKNWNGPAHHGPPFIGDAWLAGNTLNPNEAGIKLFRHGVSSAIEEMTEPRMLVVAGL